MPKVATPKQINESNDFEMVFVKTPEWATDEQKAKGEADEVGVYVRTPDADTAFALAPFLNEKGELRYGDGMEAVGVVFPTSVVNAKGKPLFPAKQVEGLKKRNPKPVLRILQKAMELLNDTPDVEEQAGN